MLSDYQQKALDAIEANESKILFLKNATGTGKTRILLEYAKTRKTLICINPLITDQWKTEVELLGMKNICTFTLKLDEAVYNKSSIIILSKKNIKAKSQFKFDLVIYDDLESVLFTEQRDTKAIGEMMEKIIVGDKYIITIFDSSEISSRLKMNQLYDTTKVYNKLFAPIFKSFDSYSKLNTITTIDKIVPKNITLFNVYTEIKTQCQEKIDKEWNGIMPKSGFFKVGPYLAMKYYINNTKNSTISKIKSLQDDTCGICQMEGEMTSFVRTLCCQSELCHECLPHIKPFKCLICRKADPIVLYDSTIKGPMDNELAIMSLLENVPYIPEIDIGSADFELFNFLKYAESKKQTTIVYCDRVQYFSYKSKIGSKGRAMDSDSKKTITDLKNGVINTIYIYDPRVLYGVDMTFVDNLLINTWDTFYMEKIIGSVFRPNRNKELKIYLNSGMPISFIPHNERKKFTFSVI